MTDADDAEAPPPEFPRRQAIIALGANLAVLVFCFPLGGLIGAIIAGIGLSRTARRPESAATFIRWSWIVFAASLLLTLAFTIWAVATN